MALNEERPSLAQGSFARQAASLMNPLAQMEHLLKVASSVSQDANGVWAEIWNELKPFASRNGEKPSSTFVPQEGWQQFLEKFWLMKHYLDSIHRICNTPPGGAV